MRRLLLIPALAMVFACQRGLSVQPVAGPPPQANVPAARAFAFDDKTDLVEFHYAWPSEAAAIPVLAARLTKRMNDWRAKLLSSATEDKAYRDKNHFPFNAYTGSMDWTTAGQSPRLLSLSGKLDEYTGGAHGNHGTQALLWDRQAGGEIAFAGLFINADAPDALLHDLWCKALDAERTKKRGENAYEGGEFNRCPDLKELAIIPVDATGDGRFETVRLIADPYVAGPYAEGNYEVALPVRDALVAALKPEYRAAFEAQPQ
jgi:hypothetical protein